MFEYDKEHRIKIAMIRLIDALNPFKARRFISSVIYLEIEDNPKTIFLQITLNKFSGMGWELVSRFKNFDYKNVDIDIYIFKKRVGRLEYRYYTKILEKTTKEVLEKFKDSFTDLDENIGERVSSNSGKFGLDSFKKYKSKNNISDFLNDFFENDGGN